MNNKARVIAIIMLMGMLLYPRVTSQSQSGGMVASGVVAPLLQYQGRLTDPATGRAVADGSYSMNFQLFDVEAGGAALWTEGKSVTVHEGLFSTVLGNTTALPTTVFNGQALWLGVSVNGEPLGPRQAVLPVAYALSLVPGAVVAGSTTPVLTVNNLSSGEALRVGGNLTINGSLIGGSHTHNAADLTSGSVADALIPAAITRDGEIVPTVLSNDGTGSTLDADLLDGLHANVLALKTDIVPTVLANDGAGSALDADLLDGNHATAFAPAVHTHDDRYYSETETNSLYVNSSGDTMSGALTVPKLSYSPARTRYYRISGEGFVPGSNVDYTNTYGMGGAYIATAGASGAMVAPVHLPQGAVVTAFQVFFYDNSASTMTVTLQSIPGTGAYSALASVDSSGLSGYANKTTTAISFATIDYTLKSYLIYAYCGAWDSSNLRIMGVLITYTVTEAE